MSRIGLAFLIGLAFTVTALPMLGLKRFAVVGFFLAAVVVPFPLLLWHSDVPINHTGITYTAPGIATHTLMLMVLLAALSPSLRWNRLLVIYGCIAVLYLTVGLLVVWTGATAQWAGALHWSFALLALGLGYQIGENLTASMYRTIVGIISLLFLLNGALCVAQLAGLNVSLFPRQLAEQMAMGRPVGTFEHSSTPGKFVLMMLVVVLPAIRCTDRVTRNLAWWCIVGAVPLVALTLSRANLAAVAVAIGLWLILQRRTWANHPLRVAVFIGLIFVSIPFVQATLDRFTTDPGGGSRAQIYRTGLTQLSENFWSGTGPNYYAEVVGLWDRLTADGFPLHNSFLYTVAEIGVVGGVLLLLPIFVVCAISIANTLGKSDGSPWSIAYLVTFPGLMAVSFTGWGMLVGSTLYLWYFVIGLCSAGILNPNDELFTSAEKQGKNLHSQTLESSASV
jgi:O-antigen ligase